MQKSVPGSHNHAEETHPWVATVPNRAGVLGGVDRLRFLHESQPPETVSLMADTRTP